MRRTKEAVLRDRLQKEAVALEATRNRLRALELVAGELGDAVEEAYHSVMSAVDRLSELV